MAYISICTSYLLFPGHLFQQIRPFGFSSLGYVKSDVYRINLTTWVDLMERIREIFNPHLSEYALRCKTILLKKKNLCLAQNGRQLIKDYLRWVEEKEKFCL